MCLRIISSLWVFRHGVMRGLCKLGQWVGAQSAEIQLSCFTLGVMARMFSFSLCTFSPLLFNFFFFFYKDYSSQFTFNVTIKCNNDCFVFVQMKASQRKLPTLRQPPSRPCTTRQPISRSSSTASVKMGKFKWCVSFLSIETPFKIIFKLLCAITVQAVFSQLSHFPKVSQRNELESHFANQENVIITHS